MSYTDPPPASSAIRSELAAAIRGLSDRLGDLNVQTEGLRTDLQLAEQERRDAEAARQQVERRHATTMRSVRNLTKLVAALAGLALVTGAAGLYTTLQNNRLGREVRANSAQLRDCTTPGGQCYARSQARTGEAIRRIQLTQLYIVECSRELPDLRGPEFDRQFQACVARRLENTQTGPPASPGRQPSPTPSPTAR